MFSLYVNSKLELIMKSKIHIINIKDIVKEHIILNKSFNKKEFNILNKGEILEVFSYNENKFNLQFSNKSLISRDNIIYTLKNTKNIYKKNNNKYFELIKYKRGFIQEEIFRKIEKSNGILLNINEDGIGFKTREILTLGDKLTFQFKNDDDYIVTKGKIRRVENINNKEFLYNANFDSYDKSEKEKIIKMLITIMKKQKKLL